VVTTSFSFRRSEGGEGCRGLLSACSNLLAQIGQPIFDSLSANASTTATLGFEMTS
jgi:hypothetical protein